MSVPVNLAHEDLLGTAQRQQGDFLTQLFPGLGALLLDLRACRRLEAFSLGPGVVLGFLDEFVAAALRLGEDVRGLPLALFQ